MICLFCKGNSDNSKSVEHIIPESLGNVEHVLPRGIVCDSCNNYFARKVEKELLDKPYFKDTRYRNAIESKKGKIPPAKGLILHPKGGEVVLLKEGDKNIVLIENEDIADLIREQKVNKLIIPFISEKIENDVITSRFLAKVALEMLVYRLLNVEGWIDEIVNKKELNPIREYARFGKGNYWEYHQRRIYSEEDRFIDVINHPEPYEILHEMDFLYLDEKILYFVVVIMGVEYAINLGGSEIDLYKKWLEENNGQSPVRRNSEMKITPSNNVGFGQSGVEFQNYSSPFRIKI